MNALFTPNPPAVFLAEQTLIGSILASNAAYERVGSFLTPEHFSDPVHAMLYRRLSDKIGQGQFVDALILKTELEHDRMLEEAGGTAYLAQLLSSMISIVGVGEYGQTIRDASAKREMLALFDQASRSCSGHSSDRTAQQVATDLISRLSELAEPTGVRASLADAAESLLVEADAAFQRKSGFERLDVGLPSVDRLLGGLWPGNLYYVMARSRSGKTPWLLSACRHIARGLTDGAHVHIFSLEMPATDILRVSAAQESRWTAEQIRAGQIGDAASWVELETVARDLGQLPIIVDDDPADITALRLRARQMHRSKKTRIIAIDHISLIRRDPKKRGMSLNEWMPALGQELKDLSKELGVPVLVLCQVNKSRDDRESTRPTLSDLPFDGGQAADEVHALYRRELDMPVDPPGLAMLRSAEKQATARFEWEEQKRAARGAAEWIALKRRFGATGSAHLRFDGPRMLFREAIAADVGLTAEEADMFQRGEV